MAHTLTDSGRGDEGAAKGHGILESGDTSKRLALVGY